MQFRILGPLEVESRGRLVPIAATKERALLSLLLLHADEPVSRDRLIDELWGESPPPTARHTLEVYVSRLRKTLAARGNGAVIETRPGAYALVLDGHDVDADRFERLLAEGQTALARGDARAADEKLVDALALWRGEVLGDVTFDGHVVEATRLEELRLQALESRIEAELALGRHRELVGELTALVARHPLRERFRRQLMLALYRSGRQADALEEYRRARRLLVDELGIEPGAELKQLHAAILRQDAELDAVAPPADEVRRRRARVYPAVVGIAVAVLAALAAFVLLGRGEGGVAGGAKAVELSGVGEMTADGRIAVGSSPMRVAAGERSLWVSNPDRDTVSRIDLETQRARQTIRVGDGPDGLAVGARFVWVANSWEGTVAKVSLQTDEVVDRIQVGAGPHDVVVGLGSVWTANTLEHTVSRIDPRTDVVVGTFSSGGTAPTALAAGAGSLWIANASSDLVSRLDPESGKIVAQVPVGGGPSELAWGFGSLWVTTNGGATVTRIDPRTNLVAAAVPVGPSVSGLAAGAGAVWVGDERRPALLRIDPSTNTVSGTLDLANRPSGIAVLDETLFVAVRDAGGGHRGGTLRVVGETGPLDPADAGGADRYDCLVRCWYPAVGPLAPDLATALPRPTHEGTTYRFSLRQGIRFSNGAPLRPSDVAHTVARLLRLRPTPYAAMFLGGIVGARTCEPGRCDLSRGVVADDENGTVTFVLAAPDPYFLDKLAWVQVVPASTPLRRLETQPIPGTGPYKVGEYRPGRVLRLVRNPYFREWAPDVQPDGYPDEIVTRLDVPPARWLDEVLDGHADVSNVGVGRQLRRVQTQHPDLLEAQPQQMTTILLLNTRVPPFNDARVRRALNLAVDRAKMSTLYPSGGVPTCQWLPPNFPAYRRYCPYTLGESAGGRWLAPDLARAQRLVDASGTKGMRVVYWSPRNDYIQPSADYVVSLLRRLGYRAELKLFPNEEYITHMTDRRLQVAWGWMWIADYPAPEGWFGGLLGCGAPPSGPSEICDPKLRSAVERARAVAATDPAAATELWTRIDHELTDRAEWVWLYNATMRWLFSERVGNRGSALIAVTGPHFRQLWVR